MQRSPRAAQAAAMRAAAGNAQLPRSPLAPSHQSAAPQSSGSAASTIMRQALMVALIGAGLVSSFMVGKQLANECGLETESERDFVPGTRIEAWRPPSGKCRHDYVSIIAEGAAAPSPPQLSLPQMLWIANTVRTARPGAAPSDFLVFGLGYDSAIWAAANCGGTTVFLENMPSWIKEVKKKVPGIVVHQVNYTSKLDDPDAFFKKPSEPRLPAEVAEGCFDVVLVDSPMGWAKKQGQPGRYQPVFYSINMARRCIAEGRKPQVTVFVHDAQREIEARLIKKYLVGGDVKHLGQVEGKWGRLVAVLVTPKDEESSTTTTTTTTAATSGSSSGGSSSSGGGGSSKGASASKQSDSSKKAGGSGSKGALPKPRAVSADEKDLEEDGLRRRLL